MNQWFDSLPCKGRILGRNTFCDFRFSSFGVGESKGSSKLLELVQLVQIWSYAVVSLNFLWNVKRQKVELEMTTLESLMFVCVSIRCIVVS